MPLCPGNTQVVTVNCGANSHDDIDKVTTLLVSDGFIVVNATSDDHVVEIFRNVANLANPHILWVDGLKAEPLINRLDAAGIRPRYVAVMVDDSDDTRWARARILEAIDAEASAPQVASRIRTILRGATFRFQPGGYPHSA